MLSLDVLRGIAVLLVLGNHLPKWPADYAPAIKAILSTWKFGGWVGVDLFFVLSGFLVSGLLMVQWKDRNQVQLKRFLVRRALKIYPSFYIMLLFSVLALMIEHKPIVATELVSEALFLQSYLPRLWNHTWSLAVEEHFYIGLSLAVALIIKILASKSNKQPFEMLAWGCVGLMIACLLARCVTAYLYPYSHAIHLIPTHLRIDSLGFGVLLAYVYHFHRERTTQFCNRFRVGLFLLAGICVAPAFMGERGDSWFMHTLGFSLLYLGFGALLMASVTWETKVTPFLYAVGAGIALIGVNSYSIYLWHIPVLEFGPRLAGRIVRSDTYIVKLVVYLLGSVVVGLVAYKVIEWPILKWRDRRLPDQQVSVPETEISKA